MIKEMKKTDCTWPVDNNYNLNHLFFMVSELQVRYSQVASCLACFSIKLDSEFGLVA